MPATSARATGGSLCPGIGTSHLHDGSPGQAASSLRQALAIYHRLGTPGARRIHQTLRQHGL